jgi:adenylate cyclase
VDAVECSVEVQEAIAKENSDRPNGEPMRFRIGIHVGDIMVQGENLFGDASMSRPGQRLLRSRVGICVSGTVRDQIGTKLPLAFADLAEQQETAEISIATDL